MYEIIEMAGGLISKLAFLGIWMLKIGFSKLCYLCYFVILMETALTILVSAGDPVLMESEIVRVASLITTEISEITR